jgi:chloramphenicol 3-O phosphotransferase
MRGMRHAIAAMARQGNDLIVDDVMLGRGEGQEYRELLDPFELRFIGFSIRSTFSRRESRNARTD